VIGRQNQDHRVWIQSRNASECEEEPRSRVAAGRLFNQSSGQRGPILDVPPVTLADDRDNLVGRDELLRPIQRVLEHRPGADKGAVLLRARLASSISRDGPHSGPLSSRQYDSPSPVIHLRPTGKGWSRGWSSGDGESITNPGSAGPEKGL
jgi:hypothetical protein